MSVVRLWCPILIVAFAGVACHTQPPATAPSRAMASAPAAPARPPAPPPPAPAPAARATPAPLSEAEIFRRTSLADLNAEHPLSDAFFDYDQNTLRTDARQTLQQDAQWLTKWPQTKIRLDGSCDERGSAESTISRSAIGARKRRRRTS